MNKELDSIKAEIKKEMDKLPLEAEEYLKDLALFLDNAKTKDAIQSVMFCFSLFLFRFHSAVFAIFKEHIKESENQHHDQK